MRGPVDRPIPLCEPLLGEEERHNVLKCFEDNWIAAGGEFVETLENKIKTHTGARFVVAVSSGTAAIHLALKAVGVEPEEEVLVSDLSFISPANAIRYVGAHPVFIGPEPSYWQIDPNRVKDFLRERCRRVEGKLINRSSGRTVRAILPVHILGHPCDMDAIAELAEEYELQLVEDAAEALGAMYKSRPVGLTPGIACLSFNGNKTITAGGGGAVVTDNEEWAARVRHLANQAKLPGDDFVHDEVGHNYRLSNLHAAVGAAQLSRLQEFVDRKREINNVYHRCLGSTAGVEILQEAPWARSSSWLSSLRLDRNIFGCDARAVLSRLTAVGIEARPMWVPLHRSPSMDEEESYSCGESDRIYSEVINLPSSVGLSEIDQMRVVEVVAESSATWAAGD